MEIIILSKEHYSLPDFISYDVFKLSRRCPYLYLLIIINLEKDTNMKFEKVSKGNIADYQTKENEIQWEIIQWKKWWELNKDNNER